MDKYHDYCLLNEYHYKLSITVNGSNSKNSSAIIIQKFPMSIITVIYKLSPADVTKKDGNCFYSALSYEPFGTQNEKNNKV